MKNSLLLLAVFLKEMHYTKPEKHFFLEDKSAAFDLIKYWHIDFALKRIRVDQKYIATCMYMLRNHQRQVITAYGPSDLFNCSKRVGQGGVKSHLIWNLVYDIGLTRPQKNTS
jgi:hypothetical protein